MMAYYDTGRTRGKWWGEERIEVHNVETPAMGEEGYRSTVSARTNREQYHDESDFSLRSN